MRKCKVCGKELKEKQKTYCSKQCNILGLNHGRIRIKKGRESIINKQIIEKLCMLIRAGVSVKDACQAVGISKSTYYLWRAKASTEKSSPYNEFMELIKQAQVEAKISVILEWRKKLPEDWRACEAFLKRRYPEEWGDKVRYDGGMEVKVNVGDKVRKILGNTELTKIVNAIIAEQGGEEFFEESSGESESEIHGDVCE